MYIIKHRTTIYKILVVLASTDLSDYSPWANGVELDEVRCNAGFQKKKIKRKKKLKNCFIKYMKIGLKIWNTNLNVVEDVGFERSAQGENKLSSDASSGGFGLLHQSPGFLLLCF